MEKIKKDMVKRAKKEHKDIELCHDRTLEESFTTYENKIIFWFNNSKTKSTHLMVS